MNKTLRQALDALLNKYYIKDDIHFNLATEEYLFEHKNLKDPTLFLWRNDKNIVIGKDLQLKLYF